MKDVDKRFDRINERSALPVGQVADLDTETVFAELMRKVEEAIRMMRELDQRLLSLSEQMDVAHEIALRIEANLAQRSMAGD